MQFHAEAEIKPLSPLFPLYMWSPAGQSGPTADNFRIRWLLPYIPPRFYLSDPKFPGTNDLTIPEYNTEKIQSGRPSKDCPHFETQSDLLIDSNKEVTETKTKVFGVSRRLYISQEENDRMLQSVPNPELEKYP